MSSDSDRQQRTGTATGNSGQRSVVSDRRQRSGVQSAKWPPPGRSKEGVAGGRPMSTASPARSSASICVICGLQCARLGGSRIQHPVSSITAVQNKSSCEVAHMKTRRLRVGFWKIPFTVARVLARIAAAATVSRGSDRDQRSGAAIRCSDGVITSGSCNRRNSRCGVGVSPAHRAAETAAPPRPDPRRNECGLLSRPLIADADD